jgi:hypothetical protein
MPMLESVHCLTYFGTHHFWLFHKTSQWKFCITSLHTFQSNWNHTLKFLETVLSWHVTIFIHTLEFKDKDSSGRLTIQGSKENNAMWKSQSRKIHGWHTKILMQNETLIHQTLLSLHSIWSMWGGCTLNRCPIASERSQKQLTGVEKCDGVLQWIDNDGCHPVSHTIKDKDTGTTCVYMKQSSGQPLASSTFNTTAYNNLPK